MPRCRTVERCLAAVVACIRTQEHARAALAAAEDSVASRAACGLLEETDSGYQRNKCAQDTIGDVLVKVSPGPKSIM